MGVNVPGEMEEEKGRQREGYAVFVFTLVGVGLLPELEAIR
jgi:hypothetical protein